MERQSGQQEVEGGAGAPRPYLRDVEYRSVGNANGVLLSDIL